MSTPRQPWQMPSWALPTPPQAGRPYWWAAQVQEAFPSYIQVNGRAEKEITPDEFYLSVIINERDSKGKISVESQQRDMIAALKRLGVNVEKQLKVANLSSEFFKKKTSVATAKYQLQLGSAAEVSKAPAN